ncbi:gamma-glutamyl-gamma-aminobutyrate hydrolase family protein [Rhodohalobacter halophilus]|uniref:gamma-glutamyl-gamma-aminobutyrate hydrolase family protein n=1 Tax=Rhodohalobacter halophilus TaxID=1812810 RepID=UPI00083F813C|nr:gamma-glutamyl-gamma-aminobutyrate hydrolase family protein [Rhodohalobacter halophilus]
MFGKQRPVIGVTGPNHGGGAAWFFTALSVWLAGGKPLRIQPQNPSEIDQLDGLILGGGADVEPRRYGEERIEKATLAKDKRTVFEWILSIIFFPVYWVSRYFRSTKTAPIDIKRDKLELQLLEGALHQKKPVLGICRGMQLMNVHFLGTLHQDISGFYTERPQIATIFPKKRVQISPNSKLAEILGTDICNVNALHNQAIKDPGHNVDLVAKELHNHVIQGLEHRHYPFVIGVQWHPEYLIQIKRQRNIFKTLVKTAAAKNVR